MDCYTFQELLNAVKANVETQLYAESFKLQDDDIKNLAEALKTNTYLQRLSLAHTNITDIKAQYLAEALESHKALKVLNLACNNITAVGVQFIAEALVKNKTLQVFNLLNNDIGYVGAQHIAEALKTNKTLQELNLAYNNIHDAGAQHLLNALETNNTLEELILSNLVKEINLKTLKKIELKTAFNKHLYDSTKKFINELFIQYEKLKDVNLSDIANKFWLMYEVYYYSAIESVLQFKDTSKYAFTPIGKVKLLEYFIKHPYPAQFISEDLRLTLANSVEAFTKCLTTKYLIDYFYFNRVCKPFNNDVDVNDIILPTKSLKIENDSQSVPSAPKDINNNNSQTSNESNENVFSLLPKDVFSYIALLTLNGGGINHSANVQNPDDSMNNAGDKSEHGE